MSETIRCLGLISGGLDSVLAARWLSGLGLDVHVVHVRIPFNGGVEPAPGESPPEKGARQIGVTLHVLDAGEDYLEEIKHPRFGTGKGLNPCVDCHIHMLRKAQVLADELGARFLFTGEVLGQRPMSQHRQALGIVERFSGLQGKLLRPLSARRLEPTEAELNGWVDRERLGDISGRSRKAQMALAERWGITEYPSPAGGCLLTEENFSRRLADLFENHPGCRIADVYPLKVGRHFRTEGGAKVIVGRNHAENVRLQELEMPGTHVRLAGRPGPLVVVHDAPAGDAAILGGDAAFAYASIPEGEPLEIAVSGTDAPPCTQAFIPSASRSRLRERFAAWRI